MNLQELEPKFGGKIILLGRVGSYAYGTNTPKSDVDYMGIGLAPVNYYLGNDNFNTTYEFNLCENEQGTIYELQKFINLCISCNPNVIPLLFLNNYVKVTKFTNALLRDKDLFITKRAYATFVGYAKAQLSKAAHKVTGRLGNHRKELVTEFGYDVKAAFHTIRLLRMAKEILEIGQVNVFRNDAAELIEIRKGSLTWDQFLEMAEVLNVEVEQVYKNSFLPENPDMDKINILTRNILGRYLMELLYSPFYTD
jgi:predicted nucleotidyltransferase